MEDPAKLESFTEQEQRAREHLRLGALIRAIAVAAILVFAIPSGGPWMSVEAFTNMMGRVVTDNMVVALIGHLILAFLYGWIIALTIFRLPTSGGIAVGVAMTLPLYALNYLVFVLAAGIKATTELHAFLTHFMFCLFFSVAYRAFAVPPPRPKTAAAH